MKNKRQALILEIIDKYEISTQEALINKLLEHGFEVTQTTISRDMRELRIIKGPTGKGGYKYISGNARVDIPAPQHNSSLTDSVVKIDYAMNIVVLKTLSGMANAIAVCIESLELNDVVGSVAGDDTILLVMRDVENAAATMNELKRIFGR